MHATEQHLSCGVEWHLRANPRALFIYNLALRKAGKDEFVMSMPQIAASVGWDLRTVKSAMAALLHSGLLVRTTAENVYRVLTHAELVEAGEQCWEGEGTGDGHSRSTPTSNSL
jgi:hypothetical protein